MTAEKRASNDRRSAALAKVNFALCRGLSSCCFLPAHFYAASTIHVDPYAACAMMAIFVGSMLWNNLSFALPQSLGIKTPLWLLVFAAVADGFGIVGSNLKLMSHAFGLAGRPDEQDMDGILGSWRPWGLATAWAVYEYVLLITSQRPKIRPSVSRTAIFTSGWDEQPRFKGYDGVTVWVKLYYPFRIHVVRSLSILGACLCAVGHLASVAWENDAAQLQRGQALAIIAAMVGTLVVGFFTYMSNGYDRDFTCPKVWIWHGCLGVVALAQVAVLASLGA
jgi:hypothetical protein